MVLSAASDDGATKIAVRRVGPALVFARLWEETGCRAVITELAGKRKHGFALERAVFLTVLHRLFVSGSDRAADRWREDYAIAGVAGFTLHHLYRAMAWLGEELPEKEQAGRTPFSPRCVKDVVEERLFAQRRDLLTRLDLVFMDTTSLYFEGTGGQTLGQHGYSKDHRPDLRQMILAVLIDGDGRPVCSEMWPGNTADVSTLIPVIDRLRRRFDIARVCVVADRGMISVETMAELEARRLLYILGMRERSDKLVRNHARTLIPEGSCVLRGIDQCRFIGRFRHLAHFGGVRPTHSLPPRTTAEASPRWDEFSAAWVEYRRVSEVFATSICLRVIARYPMRC